MCVCGVVQVCLTAAMTASFISSSRDSVSKTFFLIEQKHMNLILMYNLFDNKII